MSDPSKLLTKREKEFARFICNRNGGLVGQELLQDGAKAKQFMLSVRHLQRAADNLPFDGMAQRTIKTESGWSRGMLGS